MTKERKAELERFTKVSREAQSSINDMLMYYPSGKLGKKELPGFELVFASIRERLDAIEQQVLPRKKR